MKNTLMILKNGIEGLIDISSEFENMFQNIYDGKVPNQWLKSNIITIYNKYNVNRYICYYNI